MKELECLAFFLGSRQDIKAVKSALTDNLFRVEPDELFYEVEGDGRYHVTQHGTLTCLGLSQNHVLRIHEQINALSGLGFTEAQPIETFRISIDAESQYEVDFDHVRLAELTKDIAEIILIKVSESAGLHHFRHEADRLLEETRGYTTQMEEHGRVRMGRRALKIFLGRTLNLKGRIAENLYLFDTPGIAWEDEFLNRLDKDLAEELELSQRYRAIQDKLNVITENLSLFKDLLHHRHSSWLEWIIILLILVEVVDMFVLKLF